MLLACDAGNSNIVLGVWRKESLLATFRLHTRHEMTADEFIILVSSLLEKELPTNQGFYGAVISSVVPPLTPELVRAVGEITQVEPMVVAPGIKTGLNILYDDPREVGSDRIVNSVAGISLVEPPLIVLDFGTATTFDVITPPNNYIGGAICAGLAISMDALAERTAKLPRVDLSPPECVVGKTTTDSIRSGIIIGHTEMVDGMVERIEKEKGIKCKVIATGGYAEIIAKASRRIERVEPNLTLLGLRLIWEMNSKSYA